jgi:prepilin-type N-terminal cleavage/methylation domain-containing protein
MTSFLKKSSTKKLSPLNRQGFTIVELIVVIAIIAILAAITVIGYGAWQGQIKESRVQSDLANAASSMHDARNFGNGYPASIPSTFSASEDVSVTLFEYSTETFCIDGVSQSDDTIIYYIDQNSGGTALSGTCATRPSTTVPTAPANVVMNSFSGATGIDITWNVVAGATSYIAQCASDPAFVYPIGQQVATATNSASFTGLTLGSSFYCRVKGVNAIGSGPWSTSLKDNNNYWASIPSPRTQVFGIKADGSLWAWGDNGGYGSVGDGDLNVDVLSPKKILDGTIVSLKSYSEENDAARTTYFAIKSDGTVYGWGYNHTNYTLGTGTSTHSYATPRVVITGVSDVYAAFSAIFAIKTDGSLWGWGAGTGTGQIGTGSSLAQTTPVQVIASGVTKVVTTSYGATYAIRSDNTLWAWGENTTYGMVGNGTTTDQLSPVQIATGVSDIKFEGRTAVALKTDGSLWAWGQNTNALVGDGTTTHRTSPYQVIASGVVEYDPTTSAVFARKSDGTLWAWGLNSSNGIVGTGSVAQQLSPVQIMTDVSQLYAPISLTTSTMFVKKTDGSIWGWGQNNTAQLGLGNITSPQLTPQQSISGTVTQFWSGNGNTSYAVKSDGSLWAWGWNSTRQVGNNSTSTRTTPYQVFASGVESFHYGATTAYAFKTNKSLWAWGSNTYGQLGTGTAGTSVGIPAEIKH